MRVFPSMPMTLILALSILAAPTDAFAYIGPGLGAGAISAVLGVIGSVFLGLFAIIYYPIKRIMKRRRKSGGSDTAE